MGPDTEVQGARWESRVASSPINAPCNRKGILQNKRRAVENHITGVTEALEFKVGPNTPCYPPRTETDNKPKNKPLQ